MCFSSPNTFPSTPLYFCDLLPQCPYLNFPLSCRNIPLILLSTLGPEVIWDSCVAQAFIAGKTCFQEKRSAVGMLNPSQQCLWEEDCLGRHKEKGSRHFLLKNKPLSLISLSSCTQHTFLAVFFTLLGRLPPSWWQGQGELLTQLVKVGQMAPHCHLSPPCQ